MKKYYFIYLLLCYSLTVTAQDTFSIIAVDPATGEIGSAGASCVDGAASFGGLIEVITDIIPGRGGINSQAYVCIPNINLNNGIDQMADGLSPDEIILWLTENDACNSQNFNPAFRQYGVVDLDENGDPRAAGFTGASADDYKDDVQGENYSIQGNILLNESVINGMVDGFTNTSGSLAEKLMAAMQGANFAGADMRCLDRGTSSTTAYLVVYQPDDAPGEPSLELSIVEADFGVEPIDLLQDLFDEALSVDQVALRNSIRMYPNPTSDILNIQWTEKGPISSMEIFDIQGRKVFEQTGIAPTAQEHSMNLGSLKSGVYFLKVNNASASTSFKFVKK